VPGDADGGGHDDRVDPSTLPGLALWLDAAKGLTLSTVQTTAGPAMEVNAWTDQSSNATTFPRKDFAGRQSYVGKVGGKPSVLCDGCDFEASAVHPGNGPFVVEAVFNTDTRSYVGDGTGIQITLIGTTPSESLGAAVANGSLYALGVGRANSAVGSVAKTGTHVLRMRRQGAGAEASFEIAIDGVAAPPYVGAGSAYDLGPEGAFRIGADEALSAYASGLLEVVALVGTFTDGDVEALEAYLRTKYAL
jgi:hypothetical protein